MSIYNAFSAILVALFQFQSVILLRVDRLVHGQVDQTDPAGLSLTGAECHEFCYPVCPLTMQKSELDYALRLAEKSPKCKDANMRCACGSRAPFRQSSCFRHCWVDCRNYSYGREEADNCTEAVGRCQHCSRPEPVDPYRSPTEADCSRFCHRTCNIHGDYQDYKFCEYATPKCSCGLNPVITLLLVLLLIFDIVIVYWVLRARIQSRNRASSEATRNTNQRPTRGGTAPVQNPQIVNFRRPQTLQPTIRPSPSPQPIPQPSIPANAETSSPDLPPPQDTDRPPAYEVPPAYCDIIRN